MVPMTPEQKEFVSANRAIPFLFAGPRACGKTEMLLASALVHGGARALLVWPTRNSSRVVGVERARRAYAGMAKEYDHGHRFVFATGDEIRISDLDPDWIGARGFDAQEFSFIGFDNLEQMNVAEVAKLCTRARLGHRTLRATVERLFPSVAAWALPVASAVSRVDLTAGQPEGVCKRIVTSEGRILECRAKTWDKQPDVDTAPARMAICTKLEVNAQIPMTDGTWQVPLAGGVHDGKMLGGLEVFHDELGPEGRWVPYKGRAFTHSDGLLTAWMPAT